MTYWNDEMSDKMRATLVSLGRPRREHRYQFPVEGDKCQRGRVVRLHVHQEEGDCDE